jgi:phosphoribosylformylglycinamidine (FGAM) synthase-like amidotransferase family enzyme
MPIAHHGGRYFADEQYPGRAGKPGPGAVPLLRQEGRVTEDANPNGSCNNIAGVQNRAGNVAGLMPHPERNSESVLGNGEGRRVLESVTGVLLGT